jgi:DNA-binding transcriptional LysR family regulator
MNRFCVQTDEAEILLFLEKSLNLREVGELLGKDVSVISRRLKSLSEKTPFLLKQDNQWRLTAAGRKFNDWTRRAMMEQESLMSTQEKFTIATTSEFSSLIMCPAIKWWADQLPCYEIMTTDGGIESLILKGEADFGFDCGTPYSPQIAFKRGPKEDFVLVHSPKLSIKKIEELENHSFFFYNRLDLSEIRDACKIDFLKPKISFNDMASVRNALIHGEGWSLLPKYVVANEVKTGRLKILNKTIKYSSTSFGLWWNRENSPDVKVLNIAHEWLLKQNI